MPARTFIGRDNRIEFRDRDQERERAIATSRDSPWPREYRGIQGWRQTTAYDHTRQSFEQQSGRVERLFVFMSTAIVANEKLGRCWSSVRIGKQKDVESRSTSRISSTDVQWTLVQRCWRGSRASATARVNRHVWLAARLISVHKWQWKLTWQQKLHGYYIPTTRRVLAQECDPSFAKKLCALLVRLSLPRIGCFSSLKDSTNRREPSWGGWFGTCRESRIFQHLPAGTEI
jgi:hypothetical protein